MSDNFQPGIPDMYKPFMDKGISDAEAKLRSDNSALGKDIIPGEFTAQDHIPHELVEAVIWRESRWNPTARNNLPCNSSGGHAEGLGQFCINPGGSPGGSLELSDYQAVTGKKVTESDVYDPRTAIHLVAFGLGDRYSRSKDKDGKQKNWYVSAEGYSPVPGTPEAEQYKQDLYGYVANHYGEKRAKEIGNNAGGQTHCGFFDLKCKADLILGIGHDAATGTVEHEKNTASLIASILGVGAEGATMDVAKAMQEYGFRLAAITGGILLAFVGLMFMRNKSVKVDLSNVYPKPQR